MNKLLLSTTLFTFLFTITSCNYIGEGEIKIEDLPKAIESLKTIKDGTTATVTFETSEDSDLIGGMTYAYSYIYSSKDDSWTLTSQIDNDLLNEAYSQIFSPDMYSLESIYNAIQMNKTQFESMGGSYDIEYNFEKNKSGYAATALGSAEVTYKSNATSVHMYQEIDAEYNWNEYGYLTTSTEYSLISADYIGTNKIFGTIEYIYQ